MTSITSRSAPATLSAIDIQLWAREQRHRWFLRNVAVPFQAFVRDMAQSAVHAMARTVERSA
jgi:hypothetical protein